MKRMILTAVILGFLLGLAFLFNRTPVQTIEAQPNGIIDNSCRERTQRRFYNPFQQQWRNSSNSHCPSPFLCQERTQHKFGFHGEWLNGPCPEPEPTPTEEPEFHSVCRENSCVLVEGEGESNCKYDEDCQPEVTPTPTDKPDPCRTGQSYTGDFCGWSPTNDPPKYNPPVCTVEVPKLAENTQYHRTGNTVGITWEHDGTNISKWSINYGTDKDNMPYGIPYLPGEARQIDLNGLTWGGNTWIALCGFNTNSCQSCRIFDP